MVVVEFRRPERDERGRAVGARTVTRLTVRDGEVRIEGEEPEVDLEQRVVSLRTGRAIAFRDDPEEWARSLAAAYRTPYLWAEVVEDTNPAPEIEVGPVRVREPIAR